MSSEPRFRLDRMRSAFVPVRRAVAFVWLADPASTIGMAGLTLISGLLPISQAWIAKKIIDGVTAALSAHTPPRAAIHALLPFLYLEFGLVFISSAVTQLRQLLDQILDHKLGFTINSKIIRKALRLDLHYFENAEFYDRLQKARQQSEYRAIAIVKALFLLAGNIITLASFLAVLVAFSPWVALLLFGAALPAFFAQAYYSELNFRLQSWKAPEARLMTYFEQLLTVDTSAKEIKAFALGDVLVDRYGRLFWKVFTEDARLAWRRSWASLGWGLLGTLSYYGCYAWVVFRTLAGLLTLGSMMLYIAVFRQSQGAFTGVFENLNQLYENGLFMENLFALLDMPEMPVVLSAPGLPFTPDLARGLEIENVSFRYPGVEAWALRGVTLHIPPKQKLAIVGENGSGKTTLIKLLTRLYEPTEGRILYQGRDLRDWPLEDLRRRIGVIFQDFVRYQLTLKENVGFGRVESLDDAARLTKAAQQGGMEDLLASLEEGWETTLGRWFRNGRELSGGQWQKIALSRAFMREGEVIILDEPTSSLDAEKEYEIFQRFKELTADKIAVLISHRFSTVRMADRILVLHAGRIEEQGTHAELLARHGTYSRLFELQAEGYR